MAQDTKYHRIPVAQMTEKQKAAYQKEIKRINERNKEQKRIYVFRINRNVDGELIDFIDEHIPNNNEFLRNAAQTAKDRYECADRKEVRSVTFDRATEGFYIDWLEANYDESLKLADSIRKLVDEKGIKQLLKDVARFEKRGAKNGQGN